MDNRRLILLLIWGSFFSINLSHAQIEGPKVYVGIESYVDKGFENNLFFNINSGVEIFSIPYFSPEIGIEYFFGSIDRENILNPSDPNLDVIGFRNTRFNATIYSFTPKINLGKDEWIISLLPKYSIGTLRSKGEYYKLDDSLKAYKLINEEAESSKVSYLSIGIGFSFLGFENDNLSLLFSINYTGINANKALKKLNFSEFGFNYMNENTQTLGFGLKLYYNPF